MEEEMEKKERSTRIVSYYKLFSFADSYDYLLMMVGTVAAVGNGCALPMISVLFEELIDAGGKSFSIDVSVAAHQVCQVSLKFIYLAVGTGLASFLQVSCWMLTAERQAFRIRSLYLKTILRQDITFFDLEVATGEIVARMSSDTILIQDAIGKKVGTFIQVISTFAGGFFVAFTKGWHMTLAMLATIPLLAISGVITVKLMAKLESNAQDAYATAAIVADQTIDLIRTVASFSGEEQAIEKYNKALDKAYKSGVWEGLASGLGFGTVAFIFFCSYAFAIWFGGKMIVEKGYTGGSILGVILAVLIGSLSLGQASPCLSAFAAGKAAASKMFDTISRKPDIDAFNTKGLQLDNISGDIELRDIYFSYPARPNERVFCGLSLFIPSGSTAALVGESGSGKSTVISLVERFYDPQGGEVLIDGVNIKNFQLGWIRKKISLVSQEPVLFYASIRDNIAYGKDGATDEEILAAAELANVAKFIETLPQGLETMVGERGIHLSGGQKQRIAIARAILKDPKILLLDEATSALDVQSERMVQDALDRIVTERTTLIVAHRLSTIKNATQIYVIHQGKVVEKGSHSELLENPGGVYNQLLLLQENVKPSNKVTANERGNRHASGTRSSIPNRHTTGTPSSIPFGASPQLFFAGNTPACSHRTLFSVSFNRSPSLNLSTMTPVAILDSPESDYSLKKRDFSLRRLAYLNKPEIPVLLLGTLAAAANGIIYPIFGLLLSSIIQTFYEPGPLLLKHTKHWALVLVVIGLATLLTIPSSNFLFAVAGCKLIKRIRSMCFKKVVYMEISWFDKDEHSSGAIGSRLSSDATAVRSLLGDSLGMLVQNFATATAGLIIAFEANWQLSAFILVLLPLVGVSGYIQMKSLKGFSVITKKLYEEASQVVSDAISNIRAVASFCAEERIVQLYQRKSEGPFEAGVRHGLLSGVGLGLSFFFRFFINAVIFYTGAKLVKHGETTFPKVFRVFFALSMTALGISQANSLASDANKARQSAASVLDILDQQSKIDARKNSGTKLRKVKGKVMFHHISFTYPTRPGIQIFKDLCLSVHPGQTVALVGESGSGKSTAISLLQRYYNPDSGQITLDGTDIRKLKIKWLRQQMGLVSQEPVLFDETIRANIAYGKEGNASEAEVMAAAKLANAHNFISGLQHGYKTMVGERGIQLSGGQKQRVAIARAIIKAPKILLLDEATSALDVESERIVQDALDKVMLNRTALVVAHRLSTIRKADVIAMIKNGCVVEKGKHERLMSIKKGSYASMVAIAPH